MRVEHYLTGEQRCLGAAQLLQSEWLSVRRDRVVDEAGREGSYLVLERASFVLVVPFRPDGDQVLLVRKFRYPIGAWFWEFPQARVGSSAPGALVGVAAKLLRSVLHEEALGADLTIVGSFFEAYGYSNHQCYCLLARLRPCPVAPVSASGPVSLWVRREQLTSMGSDLGLFDAATIASLGLVNAGLGRPPVVLPGHEARPQP